MYIVPRELTSQIKPHDATRRDERTVRRAGGESSTGIVGEESERISWPTQKPTLLMTLSAVISGCYLSWLPGAHLLRITNLYTLLCRHVSLSRVSPSPALLSFPHPPTPFALILAPSDVRITESEHLFRRAAFL